MAATIGSLALLISAQTAPLEKDMKRAQKIAGDGASRMKQDVERRSGGSLWGNAFRTVFAGAVFQKFVGTLREGVKTLEQTNDASAAAAKQGLKQYDDALQRIQKTLASRIAPKLGWFGEKLSQIVDGLEAAGDVFQFAVFSGKGMQGLEEEMVRREMINRKLVRQAEMQKEIAAAEKRLQETIKFFKPALDELNDPIAKHLDFIQKATKAFIDEDLIIKLIDNDFDKLLKTMGLAEEQDPFAKWGKSLQDLMKLVDAGEMRMQDFAAIVKSSGENLLKSAGLDAKTPFDDYIANVEKLNQLRRAGAIDDLRLAQLLGVQVEKLADAQEKLAESKGPEALIRGTAAAFSAISQFQRGNGASADAAAIAKAAAAKAEAQRAEQIRLGQELLREEKRALRFQVMGF